MNNKTKLKYLTGTIVLTTAFVALIVMLEYLEYLPNPNATKNHIIEMLIVVFLGGPSLGGFICCGINMLMKSRIFRLVLFAIMAICFFIISFSPDANKLKGECIFLPFPLAVLLVGFLIGFALISIIGVFWFWFLSEKEIRGQLGP